MKYKGILRLYRDKLLNKRSSRIGISFAGVIGCSFLFFQNCSQPGAIQINGSSSTESILAVDPLIPPADPNSPIQPVAPIPAAPGSACMGVSCSLAPLTNKPTVTTILLALGDAADSQLVINGSSSQLIAETVIRYTSPKVNPKIIVVQDSEIGGEDPEDTAYVNNVLLKRYNAQLIVADQDGLTPAQIEGYDVVWFNNPGHPMAKQKTMETLLAFKGGVVLQGDDLANGNGFSLEALTQVKFVDNGTSVTCEGVNYSIDNNSGNQFEVKLNSEKFPAVNTDAMIFKYGNDIDEVTLNSNVEVLATAKGAPASCTTERPAIVRYFRQLAL